MKYKIILINVFLYFTSIQCRIHHLEISGDNRPYILISSFGYYQGGFLDVKLKNYEIQKDQANSICGFTLDKTFIDEMNPYIEAHQSNCLLEEEAPNQHKGPILFFTMDFKRNLAMVNCSSDWQTHVYKKRTSIPPQRFKRNSFVSSFFMQREKRATSELDGTDPGTASKICNHLSIPMQRKELKDRILFSLNFTMSIGTEKEEGLYNLYYHSCPNYQDVPLFSSFNIEIEENNNGNFLSAGDMPLPAIYFMMSILFFLSGLFWVYILNKSKHPVFKIHYLMAGLVFLKSLSLMFHAINYHYIGIKGEHVEAWAILYYVTHLMKGAVLFITLVLIGTGWTFIKYILSDRDKKLFMIVIPLQVLANIAEIILEESEQGYVEHNTWDYIFLLVDVMCCVAILCPVVWSIHHLQKASATDGKAATNLRKLKVFRMFYIMVLCYIYSTRCIVYLLQITVAFQNGWLDEWFREMATYVFFVLTAYQFRPTSTHPYFQVTDSDDDDEVEILTESGLTQGVTKVTNRSMPSSTIIESNEEEKENLLSKRESSHEYD